MAEDQQQGAGATAPRQADEASVGTSVVWVPRNGMPPWIPQLLRWLVWTALIVSLAVSLLDDLGNILLILFLSLFLTTALEPGVNYLARRGWRRGVATGLLMVVVVLGGLGIVALMVPLLVDEISRFVGRIPQYVDKIRGTLADLGIDLDSKEARDALAGLRVDLASYSDDLVRALFGAGAAIIGTVFNLLSVALFTFYLTADGPKWRRTVLSSLPPGRQRMLMGLWDVSIEKTGGYFYSRGLLALVSAIASSLVFWALGLPFPLALGIFVGLVSQFVPTIGTYIAGALPVIVGLFEEGLVLALIVLVWILAYQQIENYVLSPKITAHTMALHPAIAYGSVLVGGTLLGGIGALVALPIAATIQAFASTYFRRHELIEPAREELSEQQRRQKGTTNEPTPSRAERIVGGLLRRLRKGEGSGSGPPEA